MGIEQYGPSDRLAIALACLAGVMALVLFLVDKTPLVVLGCLLLMVALSVYPILHFCVSTRARVIAGVCAVAFVAAVGWGTWPPMRQTKTETTPNNIPASPKTVAPVPQTQTVNPNPKAKVARRKQHEKPSQMSPAQAKAIVPASEITYEAQQPAIDPTLPSHIHFRKIAVLPQPGRTSQEFNFNVNYGSVSDSYFGEGTTVNVGTPDKPMTGTVWQHNALGSGAPNSFVSGPPTQSLPKATALHGTNNAVADQLSELIDEGDALISAFVKDDDADTLSEKAIGWDAEAKGVVYSNLDSRLADAFKGAEPAMDAIYTGAHGAKGVGICNLITAKVRLLTQFVNQLRMGN